MGEGTGCARLAHEASRARPVDEVEHAQPGMKQPRGHGRLVGRGADRRRIDEELCRDHGTRQVRPARAVEDQHAATACIPERGDNGARRATRAEDDGPIDAARQLRGDRGEVGVARDQPAVAAHDGVRGPETSDLGSDVVDQLAHGHLVRLRHVGTDAPLVEDRGHLIGQGQAVDVSQLVPRIHLERRECRVVDGR